MRHWRRTDVVNGAEGERAQVYYCSERERERGKKKKEEMRDAARRAPGSKIHRERGARQVLGDCQSCNTHKRQVLECIDCLCPLSVSPVYLLWEHTPFSQGNAGREPEKTLENAICEQLRGGLSVFSPRRRGWFRLTTKLAPFSSFPDSPHV